MQVLPPILARRGGEAKACGDLMPRIDAHPLNKVREAGVQFSIPLYRGLFTEVLAAPEEITFVGVTGLGW